MCPIDMVCHCLTQDARKTAQNAQREAQDRGRQTRSPCTVDGQGAARLRGRGGHNINGGLQKARFDDVTSMYNRNLRWLLKMAIEIVSFVSKKNGEFP